MPLNITTTIPEWVQRTDANASDKGITKWSGTEPPPHIGDDVMVTMNLIGRSRVLGFFVEHGYLGVLVQPYNPPAWYVRQNGATTPGHVFGIEQRPIRQFRVVDPTDDSDVFGEPVDEDQAQLAASTTMPDNPPLHTLAVGESACRRFSSCGTEGIYRVTRTE